MLQNMVSQFTPQAAAFFGVAFSVLLAMLVIVGLAILGRLQLPGLPRRSRNGATEEDVATVAAVKPAKARKSRKKARESEERTVEAAPEPFFKKSEAPQTASSDAPPVQASAAASTSTNEATAPTEPLEEAGAGSQYDDASQLDALPDIPLPFGGANQSGTAPDQDAESEAVGDEEEEEVVASSSAGSSVFDVFTEAVVEETDVSRFAKTLKNVRIDDILAEVEQVRGGMSRRS